MKTIQLTEDEAKLLRDAIETAMQATWEMKEQAYSRRMDAVGKSLYFHYCKLNDLSAKIKEA